MARREPTLQRALIRKEYILYHVLAANWPLLILIFTIPLLVISVPISYWIYKRRHERLTVTLHPKTLKIRQGILVVHEKTIPLNKITDLAIFHGPIMRMLGLEGLRVETAGQSGAGGALATVIGIQNTEDFRDTVLDQRDHVVEKTGSDEDDTPTGTHPETGSPAAAPRTSPVLEEIRDTLMRIEKKL